MKKFLFTLLSAPVLSRTYGRLVRIRRPRFAVQTLIRHFARFYKIDMTDHPGMPEDYPSLLDFFVRPLDPARRPLPADPTLFMSPADGVLADLQAIDHDRALQVKGWEYRVSHLTGRQENWKDGWWLAVIYLSPSDYHRFHYPMDCRLDTLRHLGNRLFPVNRAGVKTIPGLFVRNERISAGFTAGRRRFHVVAVGATFVGSIKMNAAAVAPGEPVSPACQVTQNHEMGRFEMGSTLVLLLPRDMAEPAAESGHPVKAGQPLFRLTP